MTSTLVWRTGRAGLVWSIREATMSSNAKVGRRPRRQFNRRQHLFTPSVVPLEARALLTSFIQNLDITVDASAYNPAAPAYQYGESKIATTPPPISISASGEAHDNISEPPSPGTYSMSANAIASVRRKTTLSPEPQAERWWFCRSLAYYYVEYRELSWNLIR